MIAVTKTVSAEVSADLVRLGQLDLAENRVRELELKAAHLSQQGLAPRWHLVGHLQGNKARRALSICHSVHSVDSLDLFEELNRRAAQLGVQPELYLEVDYVQGGLGRTGFEEARVPEVLDAVSRLPYLRLVGLMTIAPLPDFDGDTRRAREVFARLRRLAEQLPSEAFLGSRPLLSMGMSSDFEIAAEEGSDCVRVGSALFETGEREA